MDYELLPAVFDPESALRPDAPTVPTIDVMEPRDGNAQKVPFHYQVGNVEAEFGTPTYR